MDLQNVIDNISKVFREIPKGIILAWNHDHAIYLQLGSVPPNIKPYKYPYAQNNEIACMVQEML